MTIQLSPDALAANGLKAQDALDAVQADFAGVTVGQTYVDTRSVDVVLLLPPRKADEPVHFVLTRLGELEGRCEGLGSAPQLLFGQCVIIRCAECSDICFRGAHEQADGFPHTSSRREIAA